MRLAARIISVSLACALAALGTTSASAAPPTNDEVEGAIPVTSLPFVHHQDTADATASGPRRCGNSSSVFFRFEPTEGGRYQVDTMGSEYDTVLTVFIERAGSLDLISCNDDWFNVASGLRFRARPGTTYVIMVSTCCGSGIDGIGGPLVLTVDRVNPAPLEASMQLAGASTDPISGDLILRGSVSCSERTILYVGGVIRQVRNGLFVARVYLSHYLGCVPGSDDDWVLILEPATAVVFGPGPASVRFDSRLATDGFGDGTGLPVGEETIMVS